MLSLGLLPFMQFFQPAEISVFYLLLGAPAHPVLQHIPVFAELPHQADQLHVFLQIPFFFVDVGSQAVHVVLLDLLGSSP